MNELIMLKHVYHSSSSSSMSMRGSSPAPSASFSVSTDISSNSNFLSSTSSASISPPLPKSTSLYSFESEEDSFPANSWRRSSHSSGRSTSQLSLPENSKLVPLRIYAADLRPDILFKTVGVTQSTTCEEVISALLAKCKVRFKDPRLFHLSLEVTIRVPNGTDTRASIQLENSATPLPLAECYPKGQARFCLQMKRGSLVKVFDGSNTAGWQYKSIMISEKTTAGELVDILFQYAPKNLCDTKYYTLHIEVDSWKRQLANEELIIPAQNIASRWGTPKLILGCQNPRISTSSLSGNSLSSIYDHFYSRDLLECGSLNSSEASSPIVIPRKRWRRSKSLSENPCVGAPISIYQENQNRQLLQIQDLRRKPNQHHQQRITDSVISSFARLNSRVGKYECSESFFV